MTTGTMPADRLISALEAMLFLYGEPVPIKRIASLLGAAKGSAVTIDEAAEIGGALAERLRADDRGLMLIVQDERYQLATKPEFHAAIESIMKSEMNEELTPAALETLAIIAYGSAVPRSTVDYIRGVNSSFILRNLLLRGLVEREPDPKRGNAYRYFVSFEFLRHIGAAAAKDLPDYEKFNALIGRLNAGEAANPA